MKIPTLLLLLFLVSCTIKNKSDIAVKNINGRGIKPATNYTPDYLSSCSRINDIFIRGECIRNIQKNPSICKTISNEDDKDGCFQASAQILENNSICNFVIYEARKNNCYFGVAFRKAMASNNTSDCDMTLSIKDKDECLWDLFSFTRNKEICHLIFDNTTKL